MAGVPAGHAGKEKVMSCAVVFKSISGSNFAIGREDVAGGPRPDRLAAPDDPPGVIDDRVLGEQGDESGRDLSIGRTDVAGRRSGYLVNHGFACRVRGSGG